MRNCSRQSCRQFPIIRDFRAEFVSQFQLQSYIMSHRAYGSRDSPGLKQLIQVYVCRSHTFWKEPKVLGWLEIRAVITSVIYFRLYYGLKKMLNWQWNVSKMKQLLWNSFVKCESF